MHALTILSIAASTALVAAQQEEYAPFKALNELTSLKTLQARQQSSCASLGGKPCGAKCIELTYTCCGNGEGACEVGYTCGIAANGIYGCCPIGKRCRGDAPEPSTTVIGGGRPTTAPSSGDDDEPTTTRAPTSRTTTTSKRLTPVATSDSPSRTADSGDDESSTSSPKATSGSGSSGSGSSNGNGNSNGSGSSSNGNTNGGGKPPANNAGTVGFSLAGVAGSFIAAVAALL
ncbi:hypothetical protein PWT90_08405 [Aphanocladium album]|nr:hypothetical protein PWT90_08405 [Aphanocladium album]